MKIQDNPHIPLDTAMGRQLHRLHVLLAVQINQLSEGRMAARYNAATAAPTTETWQQGDFIANSAPTEQGVAGSKYVIHGWQCVASGTPGTWVECRFLTGN